MHPISLVWIQCRAALRLVRDRVLCQMRASLEPANWLSAFCLHRTAPLPTPNTVLNRRVIQSELLKIFHSHQLRAPKKCGIGCCITHSTPLMRQWYNDPVCMWNETFHCKSNSPSQGPPIPICSPLRSHAQHQVLVASLSHLLQFRILCLQLCSPETVPTLFSGTSRFITSSKPFHPSDSAFADTICVYRFHLLTYLLTY